MNITAEEANMLCELMELNLMREIREDDEADNMTWLVMVVDLFKRMAEYGHYKGLTYESESYKQEVSE